MDSYNTDLNKVLKYGSDDVAKLLKRLEFDQDTKEGGKDADHTLRGVTADALQESGRDVEAALLRDGHPVMVTTKQNNNGYGVEGKVVPNYPVVTGMGSYPLIYHSGSVVACPQCINEYAMDRARDLAAGKTEGLAAHPKTFKVDAHYEGPPMECTECGREVESAYGDPDAEEGQ